MDERQVLRLISLGRMVVGGALVLLPGVAGEQWFGPIARERPVKAAIRALGIRDLMLGYGTYRALDRGEQVGPWVQACAASDLVDAVATAIAAPSLGARRAVPAVLVAGSSALIGQTIMGKVD